MECMSWPNDVVRPFELLKPFYSSVGEKVKLRRCRDKCMCMALVRLEEAEPLLSEASLWVLHNIEAVSQFLGLSFDGVEQEALEFFMALEREAVVQGSRRQDIKMHREVKNLQCNVNYDRSPFCSSRRGTCSSRGV